MSIPVKTCPRAEPGRAEETEKKELKNTMQFFSNLPPGAPEHQHQHQHQTLFLPGGNLPVQPVLIHPTTCIPMGAPYPVIIYPNFVPGAAYPEAVPTIMHANPVPPYNTNWHHGHPYVVVLNNGTAAVPANLTPVAYPPGWWVYGNQPANDKQSLG